MSEPIDPETTDTTAETLEHAVDRAAEAVAVQTRRLDELAAGAGAGAEIGLEHLLDVPVRITVEVGHTRLTLGELVRLSPGSLLELDRAAHEPADVLVNGKVVARGEIVTIDEAYGIRVTQVEA
jgi:flagellar motor switch protein FliN/FliY